MKKDYRRVWPGQQAQQVFDARRAAVDKRLSRLRVHLRLPKGAVDQLRSQLEPPASVLKDQWRQGFRPAGKRITATEYQNILRNRVPVEPAPVPPGDEPLTPEEARSMAQLVHAQELAQAHQLADPREPKLPSMLFGGESPFRTSISDAQQLYDAVYRKGRRKQSEKSKQRAVQRLARRFTVAPDPFPTPGRPAHPHKQLVIRYVEAIEAATGHPFPCSRTSPEVKVLRAALERALFATGPPSIETLVKIVREHRTSCRSVRRQINTLD
jgi:hypothetical protein